MNIPLLAFGLFITFIAFVHGGSVKRTLSGFKQWAIRTQYWGPIAYGAACGLLVAVITYPWSY